MIKSIPLIFFLTWAVNVSACDPAGIMNEMFSELQRIGDDGEAQLTKQLNKLKKEAEWGEERSNALLLDIADSEETSKAEEFRDATITKMFMMQSQPGLDCAEMSGLRDSVIAREQAQWTHLIREISRHLSL